MARGFGEVQPTPSKRKHKKATGRPEGYIFTHQATDGCIRVLRVEANSHKQALKKFNFFVKLLEACLSDASDEAILRLIERGQP